MKINISPRFELHNLRPNQDPLLSGAAGVRGPCSPPCRKKKRYYSGKTDVPFGQRHGIVKVVLQHTVNMDNKQVCVYGLRGTENIESKVENPHVEILLSLSCMHTVRMTDLQTIDNNVKHFPCWQPSFHLQNIFTQC